MFTAPITIAELEDFRMQVRAWLAEHAPAPPPFKLPDSFMEVGTDEQFRYLRDWQQEVYEAGYLGMAWPKEYGGHGLPQAYQQVVNSEMSRANVPFMVNVIALMWAGPTILKLGSEAQKQRYIPKMLSAEEIWCQGFSEPGHGSDLAGAQMTAVREGDEYVLDGTKIWTSLGMYAKHMILLARTEKQTAERSQAERPAQGWGPDGSAGGAGRARALPGSKYEGLSFFLAPMDVPGVTTLPIRKMTGEHGFTETRFEGARIPASCILGAEGQGWMVAVTTLAFERGAEGGQAGGISMVPLHATQVADMARALERDGARAIDDPLIRDRLVQLMIEERALELSGHRARIPALAQPRPAALPLMSKLLGSEYRRRLCAFAVSVQGGNANLYVGDPEAFADGAWQRSYMNAFSATIGGGTSQIQLNILAERVLGLPKG